MYIIFSISLRPWWKPFHWLIYRWKKQTARGESGYPRQILPSKHSELWRGWTGQERAGALWKGKQREEWREWEELEENENRVCWCYKTCNNNFIFHLVAMHCLFNKPELVIPKLCVTKSCKDLLKITLYLAYFFVSYILVVTSWLFSSARIASCRKELLNG